MHSRALLFSLRSLLLGLALLLPLGAQAPERFLDLPRGPGDGPRLVVFNPEVYNIRGLAAVRERGYLDVPGLTVVGVYHVRQRDSFEASRTFVKEKGLDWFRFHAVSGELSAANVFGKNPCTPDFEAIVQKADGAIFFGGPDIQPSLWHEKTHLLTVIEDPSRHLLELSAVFHFLGGAQDRKASPLLASRPRFPILGICLGFQTMNVGTGGTLVQDIWTQIYGKSFVEDVIALGPERWHNNPFKRLHPMEKLMSYNFHSLKLLGQGLFIRDLGFRAADHPRVLSSHHQALGRLGRGWVPIATSRDGKVVEAMEHAQFPHVLGVQFHPEHPQLWETEPRWRQRPEDPPTSYHALLEGTPPSLAFNQAIWKWLGQKIQEGRAR
ncbi:MAG: gamma-glutamyl-gamma-aminobutyrate hydrolase family protein [Acidobacteria bacterium]|nr:gamma-glutamyl-gamma-aminobutyrate hydrolase family protein [Acidobacteriota bacterium]